MHKRLALVVTFLVVMAPVAASLGSVGAGAARVPAVTGNDSAPVPGTDTVNKSGAKTESPQVGSDLRQRVQTASNSSSLVTVVLETRDGAASGAAEAVRVAGGYVETTVAQRVQARVPSSAIEGLAEHPGVTFVRRPYRPHPTGGSLAGQGQVVSDGLNNMNVTQLHRNGVTGENVTVAVVGLRFNASNPEIAGNVAETKSFGTGDFSSEGTHGTAVAELVADTAPNASLVLVEIDTMTQFTRAADWIDTHTKADVAVASLGSPTGPFNGETPLGREIRQGIRDGTQWVISSGNAGNNGHLNTTWRNADGDRWLDFAADDEVVNIRSESGLARVYVNWNDWPTSNEDYDAYLYAWNGSAWTLVDYSVNSQTGTQPPLETLAASGYTRYQLAIRNYDASGNAAFNIFLNDQTHFTEYGDRLQSVTRPAVVDSVLAVGAVNVDTNELEAFSSRGPTVEGVLKPELLAPDAVDTSAYDHPFYGTSAAAPHAAGVAALVVDASNGHLSAAELRSTLQRSAWQLHAAGPNNRTGYGLVDAEGAVDELDTVYLDDCATVDTAGDYVLTRDLNGSCLRLTADDARLLGGTHRVEGSTTALDVAGATNVTVRNVTLVGPAGLAATGSTVRLQGVRVNATDVALRAANGTTLTARRLTLESTTVPSVRGADFRLANASQPSTILDRPQAGPYLSVDATADGETSDSVVTLVLNYTDRPALNESRLRLWRYNGSQWQQVGGTVDTDSNLVSATFEPRGGVYTLARKLMPNAAVNTSRLNYGDVAVGETKNRSVVLTNTGNATLDVQSVTTTSDTYTITSQVPSTLAPSTAATITVASTPNASGWQNASLRVEHNGTGSPATVSLTTRGVAPEASVTPTTHDFGTITADGQESVQVRIANTGNQPLNVTGIDLANGSEAYTVDGATTPTVVAPDGVTNATVSFDPDTVGTANATLEIAHNASQSPATVALYGQLPAVTVDPRTVDFGNVSGNTSVNRTVTLTNNRASPITVHNATAGSDAFTVVVQPNRTLATGANTSATLTYAPATVGTHTGTLRLAASANGTAVPVTDVSLRGVKVDTTAPTISGFDVTTTASGIRIAFASAEPLADISVQISGPSTRVLGRSAFTVSGEQYSTTVETTTGGTYTVTLRRAADASGNDGVSTRTETVTVESQSGDAGSGSGGNSGPSGSPSGETGDSFSGPPAGGSVQSPTTTPPPQPDPVAVTKTDTASGATALIQNVTAETPVSVTFGDLAASRVGAVRGVNLSLATAPDRFNLSVSAPTMSVPDDAAALRRAALFFSVTPHSVSDTDIERATIRFRVPESVHSQSGNVTLYRFHDGEWHALETRHQTGAVYTATTPGFSVFAVTADDVTIANASVQQEEVVSSEPVTVTVTVVNRQPSAAARTLTLSANNTTLTERRVSVAPETSKTVKFRAQFLENGTYGLAVDGVVAGTVRVHGNATHDSSETKHMTTITTNMEGQSGSTRTTSGTTAGFGVLVGLLAIVFVAVRRRR